MNEPQVWRHAARCKEVWRRMSCSLSVVRDGQAKGLSSSCELCTHLLSPSFYSPLTIIRIRLYE